MHQAVRIGLAALVTGTAASVFSAAALAALARNEGKGAAQPLNATSHWLHGDEAASVQRADAAHTAVGGATHHASALFWAVPFEAWQQYQPAPTTGALLRDAAAMSAIAAAVDYGLTPKRLTPGWELVLSKRSLAATYAALALGLVAGSLLARRVLSRDEDHA